MPLRLVLVYHYDTINYHLRFNPFFFTTQNMVGFMKYTKYLKLQASKQASKEVRQAKKDRIKYKNSLIY